eukprot:4159956-Amphidinium_carterae.1
MAWGFLRQAARLCSLALAQTIRSFAAGVFLMAVVVPMIPKSRDQQCTSTANPKVPRPQNTE